MDRASVIVAYNGFEFDFRVLRKHYGKGTGAHRRYCGTDKGARPAAYAPRPTSGQSWTCCSSTMRLPRDGRRPRGNQNVGGGAPRRLLYYCHGDVAQMARFCLLREAIYPGLGPLEVSLYSVASALRALDGGSCRRSPLGQKRPREALAVPSSPLDGERFIEVQSPVRLCVGIGWRMSDLDNTACHESTLPASSGLLCLDCSAGVQ